ncbi:MAG: heat-inducible transcriptional repressor HrcA [Candidatus Sericytochromatia bacterium]|nr:heat-inducible transcriptional repressor HrcA [Candidatus Sericytochromatia bacterium]
MLLSSRQQAILKALIEDYILTAEPVGSRVLAKKFDFGLSPATLRNEMADLEDEGLLRQPHTSAGRIPSDAGYRIFVDVLMERVGDFPKEDLGILERFTFDENDLYEILQHTAKITAVLAQCTAIVRAPQQQSARLKFVQVLPLSAQEALVVVVTDRGGTLNRRVVLPTPMGEGEMATLTNFLNFHLRNQPLNGLTAQLVGAMCEELSEYASVLEALLAKIMAPAPTQDRVFVANASFLAEQPEFGELNKIRSLLSLLERESALANVMSQAGSTETEIARVLIGREIPLADLHECSVVTAPYSIGHQVFGEVGVMGPTRLGYPRAIAAVETMAQHLTRTLSRLFGYPGA